MAGFGGGAWRVGWAMPALLAALQAAPAEAQGSRQCAACHRTIWERYRQTGMGRSFSLASAEVLPKDDLIYYHAASDSYFQLTRRGGRILQRRYQLDAAGKPVYEFEKPVDYVLGSGNHARTLLTRTASGGLLELPLGWYADRGGMWAMNPGYDRPDHDGFRRPITYDCMFCHNAYPRIPGGNGVSYSDPLPEGIDCQRCHGDGAAHMRLAGSGTAAREEVRRAIVNPSRLEKTRQMEICMACHLETTSFPLPNAIERYERGPFDFRPGEPLGNFILNFDHAPGAGREDKFEIVNAVYRLRQSACFRKSNGAMTCTACHNPHDAPRGERAVEHYAAACRRCHGGIAKAASHPAGQDCAACHMPKRRTEDVVHAVATDHKIVRRPPPGNLLAERAERHETGALAYRGPVALYYLEQLPPAPETELYLAAAQVKQGSNLTAGIVALEAAVRKYAPARAEWYVDLAEALDSAGDLRRALPYYREAFKRNPAGTRLKLGRALRRAGQPAEALGVLDRESDAMSWHERGLSLRAVGRNAEAMPALRKAIELDPDLAEAHNNLGGVLLEAGDTASAEREFREAIRIHTEYGDARYNLAMLVGRAGRMDESEREATAAVRVSPRNADAQALLGDLQLARGDAKEALRHYQAALEERPDWARAHLGLGGALASQGRTTEAIPHLERAAGDAKAEPAVRDQAAAVLRQLGRR